MKCSKCSGTMAYEKFYSREYNFFGWRCIPCGEIMDRDLRKSAPAKTLA
jgi:hypothetical protein